jgi:CubicO group peptidase (beta-lactamase class C family)
VARHVITPLYACSFDLTHDEYQTRYGDLTADGYRLLMVDGYRSGKTLYYGGIWIRDQAAVITRARHGMTSNEYQTEFGDLRARGHQLTGVTALSSPSGSTATKFAAVWNDGSWRGYHAHHNMTSSGYQAKFDEYAADGYKVIYVTGYASNGSSRYAAIWSNHTDRVQTARHNLPSNQYQSTFDALMQDGYRIAHVNAHEAGAQTYFAGIWVRENGYSPTGRHNMSPATCEDTCKQLAGEDKRLTCLGGYRESGASKYAAVWVPHSRTWLVQGRADHLLAAFDTTIQAYMQDPARTIPGASFALTRNQKLIIARGYSWITDVEAPVDTGSLFRLASISKTLTGAAIVRLEQDGKLSLRDKIVDLIAMPGTIADARVRDITVEHLLHHIGGWETRPGVSDDPMSNDIQISRDLGILLPITQESIVRWENGKMLDFGPGTVDGHAYSNYGYMLLGLIVETVSGMPYETYVQEKLLSPLGIRRTRLGRTLLRNRLMGEVLYHSTNYGLCANVVADGAPVKVMNQYGGTRSIENIAAHGGWVASAVDLVCYASSFDDRATCPILSATSVDKLFAQHAYGNTSVGGNEHYGCGWFVRRTGSRAGQWHSGTIEGTKTLLCRWQDAATGDTFCAALLFNKYDPNLSWDLLALIRDTAATITSWPSVGFFESYI